MWQEFAKRPRLRAVSVIWGSRLAGSPIWGFCSYTPFIFSSASLPWGGGREEEKRGCRGEEEERRRGEEEEI
ncbi:hypothetical protein CRUP_034667 [Coryphaenoides rupestris]|nr:hypothetical protein CRUP_034667 [Coryphaenoides rupestris]